MTPLNKLAAKQQLLRWWGWMWLTTVALTLLIAQRYLGVIEPAPTAAIALFRHVMLVAHMGTMALVALAPALLLWRLWPRPAPVISSTLALAVLLLTALLMDTHVYQLYRMHVDVGVMNLLMGGAASETFIFPGMMYLQAIGIVIVIALATAVIGWAWWRWIPRWRVRPALRPSLVSAFLVCLFAFHGIHMWADARSYEPILVQTDVLPIRYAATAKRFMRRIGIELKPRTLDAQSMDSGGALAYPLQPVNCSKVSNPPNIVLVVIDSWRFDTFGERNTPNIARFARNAATFTQHYSGGNATRIGVFSLFYSIPGTYWHRVLNEGKGPVIVHELLDQDYDIEVFRSTPIFSPEFDRTVFAEVPNVRVRSDGANPAEWDRDLTEDFKQFLRRRTTRQPFFAFLFYDAPHSFEFPPDYPLQFQPSLADLNYFALNQQSDPRPFFNRYRNSVHYDDSLVGEALQTINAAGISDNTVIIITGDHGQEFNDNGDNFWGHNSNFSRYQTGVPFIWYQPGRPPAVYQHRTSHFDVMPTVLSEVLGCSVPFDQISVGTPLFDPSPREVMVMSAYGEFAIVQPDRVAAVRRSGVSVFDSRYRPLRNSQVAPDVIAEALKQKQRFYKGFGSKSKE
jgi:membrane-anchored protein YejM (alkaline phosphatase superfamily)